MKSSSGRSPLARFVLAVLAWLPVTFAVWYFAAPLILWPATLLTDLVARAGFGDLVTAVEQNAAVVTFATSLKAGQAIVGGVVAVEVNALLYSFGLPMFAALTLAAHEPHWLRALAIGYAVLVPAIAWGVLADFLKNIAITAAPQVASQAGFSPIQRELIVFAFQFGSLILPTVAPAIVWVLMHRGFLERIRRVAA
ncbi:MAG: exosortase H-associated membrane protein [Casimicrobiaceae bacterium]